MAAVRGPCHRAEKDPPRRDRGEFMNRLLIVGTLVISTAPLLAQGQQPNVAKLKADARNVVGIIGADKAKNQTYCKMMDLSWQMNDAAREKVQRKAKTLSQEIVQLGKRLPEFVVLSDILEQLDLNSPDGREIALIIQTLNQSCPE
jgi:hypothetical protein